MKRPPRDYPRPLQVPLIFPVVFLIGCAFLVVFPVYQAPLDTAIGIGIMLSGLPAYFMFVHLQGRLGVVDQLMGALIGRAASELNYAFRPRDAERAEAVSGAAQREEGELGASAASVIAAGAHSSIRIVPTHLSSSIPPVIYCA